LLLLRRHQCRHNTVNRFTLVASLKKNDAVSRTSPPTNEFTIATILLGLASLCLGNPTKLARLLAACSLHAYCAFTCGTQVDIFFSIVMILTSFLSVS
jgi:hypothetical protein